MHKGTTFHPICSQLQDKKSLKETFAFILIIEARLEAILEFKLSKCHFSSLGNPNFSKYNSP